MRNNERLSPETARQFLMGARALIRVVHKMASFFGTLGNLALVPVYKKSLFIHHRDYGLSITEEIAAVMIAKKKRALIEPENSRKNLDIAPVSTSKAFYPHANDTQKQC